MNSLSNIAGLSLGIMIFNSLNFMVNTPPSFAILSQQLNRQSSVLKLAQLPQQTMDKQLGNLYVQSETKSQVFPLKQTQVKAKISGNVSQVEVSQTFENPFKEPLEAIYVFPLPDQAAVDQMVIKIGDRTIKSKIETREDAKEIYQRAKAQGRTTALLEQERDNIFTQSVANIQPGEQISVTIRYIDQLKFEGGNYEFVFPMVVGPRYIPGQLINKNQPNTNQVPDADRITSPIIEQEAKSPHNIQVDVEIDAGVAIENVRSTSHKIITQQQGNRIFVSLDQSDQIPNKDLILRYQISGENTRASVLTEVDQQGGHFAAYLLPAISYNPNQIIAKDVIFLMDTSGSQEGEPLKKSQELMKRFIQGLNSEDTFNIIDFANTTNTLSETPLENTAANRQKALNYINQLEANGGTELLNGIQTVMKFPSPPTGRLRSIVLLTDGYIGNDQEIIAEVQNKLKPGNRLYAFGVGSSVNLFLLNRLGEIGRGTTQIVRQDEPTETVVETFFKQINNPILTDMEITWQGEGLKPEIYPISLSDLFDNQPLVLFGRKLDRRNGLLKITGITAKGDRYEQTLPVNFPEINNNESGNIAIAKLWGRARIKDLMNQMFSGETKSGVEGVTRTALSYQLLSEYTAFIAVSEEVRVDPNGTRQTVEVPLELPQGVSYDGIFGTPKPAQLPSSAPINFGPTRSASGYNNYGGQRSPEIAPPPPPIWGINPEPTNINAVGNSPVKITVVEVAGISDRTLINDLNRYLQGLNLADQINGKVTFEMIIDQGNVQRAIFDDIDSNLDLDNNIKQAMIIDKIRRSLLTWQPSNPVSGKLKITLELKATKS
ncbi:VIT domain-containing protein [Planktothrix agardhii]|uniref:VIT domain-containing protein n=1 Tax=Planktothrix agardhii TaxID=1160 RepID=UPI001F40EDAE|nr:VIT domain-containing protein [Planktothrix agardhii]MCF3574536.1 after-VIT domain-containing protein [Planktothrix agardhii 1812]MCF3581593.1 after-VIT domain-containing protein [Planktothrix agardhii 1811]